MTAKTYLCVDLGAGSGRVAAILFDGTSLRIEEVHRFGNQGVRLPTGWHWNLTQLFADILAGLGVAHRRYGDSIVSLGIDTWGVDYGLVDERGRLLGVPWMYRDARTDGGIAATDAVISREDRYHRTGIQSMFFNSLYQLAAEARHHSVTLAGAHRLLFTPDLLAYWLTGCMTNERTIASTSEMLRAGRPEWDVELAESVGIPTRILHPLIEPGTAIGELLPDLQTSLGCGPIKVIAVGTHDTASAAAGVPSLTPNPLFLSSGTWSLVGCELDAPIVTPEANAAGFSNEHGLNGTTRFLKNVAGMWLLQECKRAWDAAGSTLGYAELVEAAREVEIDAFIDPDAPAFARPGDMPATIQAALRESGQPAPESPGALTRVIIQSLAAKYREVLANLRALTGSTSPTLHIVGGGSQNALLNQMTADATGLRVEAGPIEATVAGNALAQMLAAGDIASLAEGRALIRRSFAPTVFEPRTA